MSKDFEKTELLVVGLLYNFNGMATWCLEAVHAIHNSGQNVILVIDEQQRPDLLNMNFPFPVLWWKFETSSSKQTLFQKIKRTLKSYFFENKPGFALCVQKILNDRGQYPTKFILNQSDLYDRNCTIPQYVVGWAYPGSLAGYISKAVLQSSTIFSLQYLSSLHNAIKWHNRDFAAYRFCSGVLAVSSRLETYLKSQNIKAHLLYPPLDVKENLEIKKENEKIKILFAAVDLENKQKNIEWGLNICSDLNVKENFEIHLVGKFTYLKEKIDKSGLKAIFHGLLSRESLSELMKDCDLFVFCSSFDDWGYVQVEAMAVGMAVIAPEICPSDEIILNKELLYLPGNKNSFKSTVEQSINKHNLFNRKQYCKNRSITFGHQNFIKQLNLILNKTDLY